MEKYQLKINGKIYSSHNFVKKGLFYIIESAKDLSHIKNREKIIVLIKDPSDNLYNLHSKYNQIGGTICIECNILSHLAVLSRDLEIPSLSISLSKYEKLKKFIDDNNNKNIFCELDCTKGLYKEGTLILFSDLYKK
jgi:phosphohistidine swiveling domain-containing protein